MMVFDNDSSIYYRLLGLPTMGSVLHTGSHPDDEDTGLLTYLRCKYGISTTYWCANRGEAGMNRVSQDRGEALGVIRTWEAMDAASIGFFDYHFGPFKDFGFSASASEGFAIWNQVESVLDIDWKQEAMTRDIVRAIRQTRPLIVVSRWSGTPKDFHGQHQSTGIATIHAFELAGDPEAFPELTEQGYAPWQPLKLYISVNNPNDDQKIGGALNATLLRSPELEARKNITWVNTGELDAHLKVAYQERAWESFNCHQSQAVAQVPRPGDSYYYYKLLDAKIDDLEGSEFFEKLGFSIPEFMDLMDLSDPKLLQAMDEIYKLACQARDNYQFDRNTKKFEGYLLKGLKALQETQEELDHYEINDTERTIISELLEKKEEDFKRLIADCLGLRFEALSERPRVVNFDTVTVFVNFWNYSGHKITDLEVKPIIPHDSLWEQGSANCVQSSACASWQAKYSLTIGNDSASTPYWLEQHNEDSAVFDWPDEKWAGQAVAPERYRVSCHFTLQGVPVSLDVPIIYRESIGTSSRTIPLRVIEPVSIEPMKTFHLISNRTSADPIEVHIRVRRNSEEERPISGNLFIDYPEGCRCEPDFVPIHLDHPNDVVSAEFKIIPDHPLTRGKYQVSCRFQEGQTESTHINVPVRKPGAYGADAKSCLNETFIRYPAEIQLAALDLELPEGMRYGLIPGQSNEMFSMLSWDNCEQHILNNMDIERSPLESYDAIIVGANAYIQNHQLQQEASRFLEYVHQGGTLIVMFQRYDYATPGFAPYRFSYDMPHNRVTDNEAPVFFLEPEHSIFKQPNKISNADFEGWHTDRGTYFWKQWDKRYMPLLETGDPGYEPQKGGLMYTRYGKGQFIYCGYSLHRQILKGVEGAIRLFTNLLDLPKQTLLRQVEQLQAIPLFSKVQAVMLEPIAQKLEAVYLKKGDIIEYGSTPHQKLGIVQYGLLERSDKKYVHPGESFGENSLFLNSPGQHAVRAKEDSLVLILSINDWWSIIQSHPSTVKPVMEYMAEQRRRES